MYPTQRLFLAARLTLGSILALTAFNTSAEIFASVSPTPPRICSVSSTVTVVAGPDSSGSPTQAFPQQVDCPGVSCPSWAIDTTTHLPLVGQFLLWNYQFNYNGGSHPSVENSRPNKLAVSVSDDTSVAATFPATTSVSKACAVSLVDDDSFKLPCEARVLNFQVNGSSNQKQVAFLTPSGYSARIASAGALQGNGDDTTSYCLLAGAGKLDNVNRAVVESQVVTTPGCSVTLSKDSQGRVIDAKLTDPSNTNCHIDTTPGTFICDSDGQTPPNPTNCKVTVAPLPQEGITSEGSCNYSYTNAMGGRTTIACTSCCVQASTNKCVQKTSLTSPSTQCTASSF